MKSFRKLAFVVNAEKSGAPALARDLIAIARRNGAIKIKVSRALKLTRGYFRGFDACCVIGGDGTLLGVVREAARENIPVIGVNQGSLGFLTTFSAEEARAQFASLLGGDYELSRRTLLECKAGRSERDVALNDVLVKNETNSRLVRLEVQADGRLVTEYYCDGVIFSTPTGSTAYNLAAGGPIIHPGSGVIAMTPICPHTLSNRTIIFRDTVKLTVINRSHGSRLLVAMDGQRNTAFTKDEPIEMNVSPRSLGLAQRRDYSPFEVMRAKLQWSGGFLEKK